jgi:hypothetical protein
MQFRPELFSLVLSIALLRDTIVSAVCFKKLFSFSYFNVLLFFVSFDCFEVFDGRKA